RSACVGACDRQRGGGARERCGAAAVSALAARARCGRECESAARALSAGGGATVTRARSRLRAERGQGIVSALILLAGVLLPLLFVVPLFARLEQGRLEAEQAARDAVRAAVEAPNPAAAQDAAADALARAQTLSNAPLRLQLSGAFARGSLLTARVQ